MTSLISVVGAVEGALIREFVQHYRNLGVSRFLIGVHFPPGISDERATRTLELLDECVEGGASHVGRGPWVAGTNGAIRDELRRRAGEGWHVMADVDEFQQYPGPLPDALAEYEEKGEATVEGLLFDRVAESGDLSGWDPDTGLDSSYPLGGFLTSEVLRGDPRKVMAARWDMPLGSGNHWAPGIRVGPSAVPPLPVHHFKWRAGCRDYLEARRNSFAGSSTPDEVSMRAECSRALAHLEANGGRIDVSGAGRVGYVTATLHELPPGWQEMVASVMRYWWQDRWTTQ